MTYTRRLIFAATCSLLLHVAIMSPSGCLNTPEVAGLTTHSAPVVLNLQPPQRPVSRRLVEGLTQADLPVEPTDLISDRDSKAQDPSDVEGLRPAPYFERPAEFDDLDGGEPVPEPLVPAPLPTAQPNAEAPEPAREEQPASPTEPDPVDELNALTLAKPRPEPKEEPGPQLTPEPVLLAKAQRPAAAQLPPGPQPETGQARGRVDGGVRHSKGFVAFEVMADEIAPYLLEVRKRVERQWFAALSLKYSGTSPTKAVVECAINAEGELLYATIVEPGESASYAPLCKEAIEKAGPFSPFPFEVPDVYRSKDLEIRWTFNFLE